MLDGLRFAALAAGTLFAAEAFAACPSGETVLDDLTCSSSVSATVADATDTIGGSCSTSDCYTCGDPFVNLTQPANEDVYSFTCQATGTVTLDISGMKCDLDIYILDDSCDPYTGCEAGSTKAKTATDSVSFSCVKGSTYYVVVEAFGYYGVGSSQCKASSPADYTLSFDVSAGTGCTEDCDNLVDDDLDGDADCDDSDCAGDPVCGCDADGDGYDSTTCTTGTPGTDCNDTNAAVNPGATETCNSIDDDCDGSIDEGVKTTYYRDADGDGYGLSTLSTSACSAPSGYVTNSTDCNDASAAIKPGATETCNSIDDDCDGLVDEGIGSTWYRDADGDGYGVTATTSVACTAPSGYVATGGDCDDTKATVKPGATETCNGIDDDCDGTIDEGVKTTYYRDADSDGYGTSLTSTAACSAPSGYVASSTDCDDTKATVNPAATETCNGVDDDCDGTIDDGVKTTYYADADGDGYGRSGSTTTACSLPSGYVTNSTDCDDARATVNPAADEYCNGRDDDCDGTVDEATAVDATTWYRDSDGDSYGDLTVKSVSCSAPTGYVSSSTDCDDTRATVYPGATETCNTRDDDCDGSIDEGTTLTFYRDADSDGYGTSATPTTGCTAPTGYVANSTDCDDTKAAVSPAATETCNSIDDDCDGSIDEGVKLTYYRDADGDSYGTSLTTITGCTAPSGYVANSTDCDDLSASDYPGAAEAVDNGDDEDCDGVDSCYRDADVDAYGSTTVIDSADLDCLDSGESGLSTDCSDSDATTYPGASEICDGIDNDCDGSIDEGATTAATWYRDADSDGYGDPAVSTTSCAKPSGYVNNKTDCDDTKASVYPGASEVVNDGIDQDCDSVDSCYTDADNDNYGTSVVIDSADLDCADANEATVTTDCDDTRASVYPTATETCNSIDDDCDGSVDEGVTTTYYRDADADGYGSSTTTTACTLPTGYATNSTDCDDTKATVNPAATEYCNSIDDDCDGTIDESSAADATTWYDDDDSDGFGDLTDSSKGCTAPTGYVATSTDCDDTRAAVYPGAPETCNLRDDDCDGAIDEGATDALTWYEDSDSDLYGDVGSTSTACTKPTGYVADKTDCDDSAATVHPGATEVCNSVDDDCDGVVDDGASDATTWYADTDKDLYGDASSSTKDCAAPTGYVADSTDCDDEVGTVNPGADEYCNLVDDDCDGSVDEADAIDALTWYADADDDAYGDATVTTLGCSAPSGYVADDTDCDDADATSYPGAVDVPYDGIDQDCDGSDLTDADGDGFSWDGAGGDDCDDSDADVSPDGTETADGTDENCDGVVDEETDWYDDDGDGFAEAGGDCDDAEALISPTGIEECDGVDQDCDGIVDNDTDCYDDDGDGTSEDEGDCNDGDAASSPDTVEIPDNGVDDDCDGSVDDGTYDPDGDGYTEAGGDCDNEDGTSYPGAPELPDGLDNDCDKITDEGTDAYDDDGDGYTELFGDCDDSNPDTYAGADEIPGNGVDDDCDGIVDEGSQYTDDDGDGFSENGGDCDDYDSEVNPGAEEVQNGTDDDCDGEIDEGFVDVDRDGYTQALGDCDDLDGWTNPGASEACDGVDNDCNGTIDDGCDDDGSGTVEERKCGCETGGMGLAGVAPWMILVLALRKRGGRAS